MLRGDAFVKENNTIKSEQNRRSFTVILRLSFLTVCRFFYSKLKWSANSFSIQQAAVLSEGVLLP